MSKIIKFVGRLSFPDLLNAREGQDNNGEPNGRWNWAASALVDPKGPEYKLILDSLKEVAKERWGAKFDALWADTWGNKMLCCFLDGNRKEYDGYKDQFVLAMKKLHKVKQKDGQIEVKDAVPPPTIDRSGTPVSPGQPQYPYAGCFCQFSVEMYATGNNPKNTRENPGLRAKIRWVQFARDGAAFSAGTPVTTDEFAPLDDGASAADGLD